MKHLKYLLVFGTLVFFTACHSVTEEDYKEDKNFPKVRALSEYKSTTFISTLETSFDSKSNGIYAASLLMAWDEVKKAISGPLTDFESQELEQINASKGYKNALSKNEYFSSTDVQGSSITAKAYFKKSLPFVVPLEKDEKPMFFLNQKVESFGFRGYNTASEIVYYKNDEDFAIKLIPSDQEHEIILLKSKFIGQFNFKKQIESLNQKTAQFAKKRDPENDWKYYYNEEDRVCIPSIVFNIGSNYDKIIGSHFTSAQRQLVVDLLYQRTAFVLNEKGAEVESEALVAVTEEMEEHPKPKNLIFNKPFIILLKRKEASNPYFALFVANAELMKWVN